MVKTYDGLQLRMLVTQLRHREITENKCEATVVVKALFKLFGQRSRASHEISAESFPISTGSHCLNI